jgi:hypothetical protein
LFLENVNNMINFNTINRLVKNIINIKTTWLTPASTSSPSTILLMWCWRRFWRYCYVDMSTMLLKRSVVTMSVFGAREGSCILKLV